MENFQPWKFGQSLAAHSLFQVQQEKRKPEWGNENETALQSRIGCWCYGIDGPQFGKRPFPLKQIFSIKLRILQ